MRWVDIGCLGLDGGGQKGAQFHTGFTVEDVAARFNQISDFSEGAEYPEDADSGEVHSMKPPMDLPVESLDSMKPVMSKL